MSDSLTTELTDLSFDQDLEPGIYKGTVTAHKPTTASTGTPQYRLTLEVEGQPVFHYWNLTVSALGFIKREVAYLKAQGYIPEDSPLKSTRDLKPIAEHLISTKTEIKVFITRDAESGLLDNSLLPPLA